MFSHSGFTAENVVHRSRGFLAWKVVYSAPHKLIRPVTDGERELEHTLVVSLHQVCDMDMLENKLLVGVDSLNQDSICGTLVPMVFSPAMLTSGVLLHVHCWEELTGQEEFRFSPPIAAPDDASKGHLRDLLQDLFLHSDKGVVLADHFAIKSRLLELLCAENVVLAGGPPWKLSALGRQRLRACQWVGKRRQVFQTCDDPPRSDATLTQLLLYMRDNGWEYRAADKDLVVWYVLGSLGECGLVGCKSKCKGVDGCWWDEALQEVRDGGCVSGWGDGEVVIWVCRVRMGEVGGIGLGWGLAGAWRVEAAASGGNRVG